MTQEPPFAIQVEPTEGCTLACSFCALQSIRDNGADAEKEIHGTGKGPYRFMSVELAQEIGEKIANAGWTSRIEFAMHGEPTVNPRLAQIIRTFRDRLPGNSLMVTSNGSGATTPDRIHALFNVGLNTLAIDNYKHASFVAMMRRNKCFDLDYQYFRYPRDKDGNPHRRYKGKRIVVIDDISDNTKGVHRITNQGGNSFTAVAPLERRCAKPFRELSIRWNGNVALCCDDWKGRYKIGNIKDMPIEALWNHDRFRAARAALYDEQRKAIKVCSGCNVRTYRNGLLPDKMGKENMPAFSKQHRLMIEDAEKGIPYTIKGTP